MAVEMIKGNITLDVEDDKVPEILKTFMRKIIEIQKKDSLTN